MDDDNVLIILSIIGILALVLVAALWFIDDDKYIVVDDKWWISYAEWTEDYHTTVCKSVEGKLECTQERRTRTLCDGRKEGRELPVTYPQLNCRGEDYSEYVNFYVKYHEEDGREIKTGGINGNSWGSMESGDVYVATINLLGYIKRVENVSN